MAIHTAILSLLSAGGSNDRMIGLDCVQQDGLEFCLYNHCTNTIGLLSFSFPYKHIKIRHDNYLHFITGTNGSLFEFRSSRLFGQ